MWECVHNSRFILTDIYILYKGESKVLRYLGNVKHNSAAPYATRRICLGIHDFRPTQPCLVVTIANAYLIGLKQRAQHVP